jgi:Ca-activated chloride channel family protein
MHRRALFAVLLLCAALVPAAARPCAAALVFAMDVSGSVDAGEYRLQTEGLADALDDPAIAATLVEGAVALAVVQWSGLGLQRLALPWRRIGSAAEAAAFAAAVRAMPRAFTGSDTAVGEGLAFALPLFAEVPDCARRIVDISGDGAENVGFTVTRVRREAIAMRVEVNALAIESIGLSITQFYRSWVVTPGGFVVTARGHTDFARAMRIKIMRELARPVG